MTEKVVLTSNSRKEAEVIKKKRALNVTPYVIIALLFVCVLQAVVVVLMSRQQLPPPNVYATDGQTGSVTKLIALQNNTQEGLGMTNFALNTVTQCMSLDFAGFKDTLETCRQEKFSKAGYAAFELALRKTDIYNPVSSGRAIVKVVADGIPTLLEPGRLGSDVVYTIEVPILFEKKLLNTPPKAQRQVAVVMIGRDKTPEAFDLFRVVRLDIEPRG